MVKKIGESVFYLKGGVNIGFIVYEDSLIVIDTGFDKGYGRKILKISKDMEKNIVGIINTHSHADHFGGNGYLQDRVSLWVTTSKVEKAIIENPIFEPMYLFGGAPFGEIRTKFLEGKPSYVDFTVESDNFRELSKEFNIKIVDLPGHSPGQIGIFCDDVLFVGDAIMPSSVIKKYKIVYTYDPYIHKQTLYKLKEFTDINAFIPGHGEAIIGKYEMENIININLENIVFIEKSLLELLENPVSTEDVFSKFILTFDINLTIDQLLLLYSTIKGFLSGLKREGRIDFFIENGRIMWKKRA